MNKKIIFIFCIIVILFAFKLIFFSHSDKDIIRDIIYRAKTAIEKENLLKGISYISNNYRDKDKNSRSDLFYIGKNIFQVYSDIAIAIEDLKIEIISNSKAIAQVRALGQGRHGSLRIDRQEVGFRVVFRKESKKWMIVELDFIDPGDFLQLLKKI